MYRGRGLPQVRQAGKDLVAEKNQRYVEVVRRHRPGSGARVQRLLHAVHQAGDARIGLQCKKQPGCRRTWDLNHRVRPGNAPAR